MNSKYAEICIKMGKKNIFGGFVDIEKNLLTHKRLIKLLPWAEELGRYGTEHRRNTLHFVSIESLS